ncbi:MAG: DeoR/GlpR family DNA-binding transcription regulator [Burkholderiaceae bacterium]
MPIHPRQKKLLDEVRSRGTALVDELARQLDVTPQTIRRDIGQLVDAGLLSRFHGGATLPQSTTENIAYLRRVSINARGKQAIARALAAQVPNGSSLFINIGTTTEEVARALRHHRDLRVVTNNLNVAAILADNASCEVIVAGGVVRSRDRGIVGESTVDFIRQFKVDIGLIGISSIELDGSLRDFDIREVKVAQAIIAQSRSVWLAADQSKFGRQAMVQLATLSQIDALFTDAEPPAVLARMLHESGGRYVVAH